MKQNDFSVIKETTLVLKTKYVGIRNIKLQSVFTGKPLPCPFPFPYFPFPLLKMTHLRNLATSLSKPKVVLCQ